MSPAKLVCLIVLFCCTSAVALTTPTGGGGSSMGLVATDFGAKGDGVTNNAVALQTAIDAAQSQRRTLLLPAGTYMVNATLQVSMKGPLRIVGEGKYTTAVAAMVSGMFAVFNISWNGIQKEGTNHEFSQFTVAAEARAQYGVYAPGLTRSYFSLMSFTGALQSGFYHGGWIDVIDQCSFNGNHFAGLQLTLDNNNVVIRGSSFEGNPGYGIVVQGGAQITLQNNCIEGNGMAGVVATAVMALSLRSNYFEANTEKGPINFTAATNTSMYADIIISGSATPTTTLAAAYPCSGVELDDNYFHPRGASVDDTVVQGCIALVGVQGATISNNAIGGASANQTLVLTNPNRWVASDVSMHSNTGCGSNYLTCVKLQGPNQLFRPSALYTLDNTMQTMEVAGGISEFALPPISSWNSTGPGQPIHVQQVGSYGSKPSYLLTSQNASQTLTVTFPLSDPTLVNVPVYMAVRYKLQTNNTVFALVINGCRSSDYYSQPNAQWAVLSYQGEMAVPGPWSFGIWLEGTPNAAVIVTNVVVAPIGIPFHRVTMKRSD